jgi:hypothetical protein
VLKVKADGLDWRNIDGEIVALDLRSSTYLAINRSGARLWPMLVLGADREALVELLVSEYDLTAEQAAVDVGAFLDLLSEWNLLEVASSTTEG